MTREPAPTINRAPTRLLHNLCPPSLLNIFPKLFWDFRPLSCFFLFYRPRPFFEGFYDQCWLWKRGTGKRIFCYTSLIIWCQKSAFTTDPFPNLLLLVKKTWHRWTLCTQKTPLMQSLSGGRTVGNQVLSPPLPNTHQVQNLSGPPLKIHLCCHQVYLANQVYNMHQVSLDVSFVHIIAYQWDLSITFTWESR